MVDTVYRKWKPTARDLSRLFPGKLHKNVTDSLEREPMREIDVWHCIVPADLYAEGKLSETQKGKLVTAHDVYRPAAQTVVAGCKAVGSQGDADKLVAQLKIAADKLIETLVTAGVIR